MIRILTIILIFSINMGLAQHPNIKIIQFTPKVIVKDTIQKAYDRWCDHPNCWSGVSEKFVGMDTLRIFRTYITVDGKDVLIDQKKVFVTDSKGSSQGVSNYFEVTPNT